jgi:hypothetical protein
MGHWQLFLDDWALERATGFDRGYFAAQIPGFLGDPARRDKLLDSGGEFSPRRHLLHFWDEAHREWVAMDQGVVPHWLPSREIGRFASPDLVHWTSSAALYPDPTDPHLLWSESGGFDRLLPGFGFGGCEVVRGDHPEAAVRFRGALRGQAVHLLFQMADAELYGFRFA